MALFIPFCSSQAEDNTLAEFPKPPKNPCVEADKMCDFTPDCAHKEDEAKCGVSARPVPFSTPFTFCTSTQEVALKLTSCIFLQGTFPTRRAARAGLTPASGVKVGICIKILHLKVKPHFHSIILSPSHPVISHIAHICLVVCCRGVPVPSGSPRPAAD